MRYEITNKETGEKYGVVQKVETHVVTEGDDFKDVVIFDEHGHNEFFKLHVDNEDEIKN